jgi:myo-inositol-1(or 4)-monophosphatase
MSAQMEMILSFASQLAREASQILLKYFGDVTIHEKSTQNLVTQADFESESYIREAIRQQFPSHVMLGEEGDQSADLQAEHLWVVDPLDGTNNYAHGIPQFCVSIAYAQRGVVEVGVVYDPVRNELFTAVRGAGAWRNGEPIRVSPTTDLNRGIFATGFFYERGESMERTLDSIRTLFRRNIRGIRRFGAAALDLSWVACGRFQGFFEYKLAPWDFAAGGLIVAEAGGVISNRAGEPLRLTDDSAIVACPGVNEALMETVRWPLT